MPVFQPDGEVIQRIVRAIEDVLQHVPESTDFVEQSDSVEPKTVVVATMNMESTVAGNQVVAVETTMDMEWTVTVHQTAAGDQAVDMTVAVDLKMNMESISFLIFIRNFLARRLITYHLLPPPL